MTTPTAPTAPPRPPLAPEPSAEPVTAMPDPTPLDDLSGAGKAPERVIGLRGKPVNRPSGLYALAVDEDGEFVKGDEDLPIRVRPNGPMPEAAAAPADPE